MAFNACIWSCENTSHSHIRTTVSLRLIFLGTSPGSSIPRMAIALIYDHVGTNPTVVSEWLSTHIWHGRNQSSHHDRMAHPLHLTMERTNPLTMTEWLSPYIWPWKEPILSPCQNGSRTHHFPLGKILIWRTPNFSLKYSKFTLANGFVNTSTICLSIATY